MSKILFINSVFGYGSTGKIILDLARECEQDGYEVKIAYGRTDKISGTDSDELDRYGVRIGNDMDVYFHVLYTRVTDKHGLASKMATRKFLKWAEEYNPDVLWLHNIHGYYINYELLFHWIKSRPQMQVKWTLHDCWTFTGHCSHFTYVGCEKWKHSGCSNCPQLNQYPETLKDNSVDNFLRKGAAFTGVPNLTIITPSNWLKNKVKESFLSDYPVEVKYNTINTDVFKPTPSNFKQEHGIQDKRIILGVASKWNDRKGLNDFIELSKMIRNRNEISSCDECDDKKTNHIECDFEHSVRYKIVLVGLAPKQIQAIKNEQVDILALPRTESVQQLVEIYSAADVFVNPTYEDTFPTVNMEAEACGTKVITYNTGGCCETIHREDSITIQQGTENIFYTLIKDLQ